MNFWRIIALPMAAICFVLAVLYTFVWWTPAYVLAGIAGTGIYTFMYFTETKKNRRYR